MRVRTSRSRTPAAAVVFLVLTMLAGPDPSAAASPPDERVPDHYIVVLRDGADPDRVAAEHAREHGAQMRYIYRAALRGYAARMSATAAERIARHPAVAYVEQDARVAALETQRGATWGLDRIDQRHLPLNGSYVYNSRGSNVNAYVLDTGIRRDHVEFGGRASIRFAAPLTGPGDDCNGHGTHVAGTLGGATYGVAKAVNLIGVRVLNCAGIGLDSDVIAGINWVTADHDPGEPAVANMSLGGPPLAALDQAVRNSIADGITYVIASGNDGINACLVSPARVTEALTVGATTKVDDRRGLFSNHGSCVDIFAPGSGITSAWSSSPTATATTYGTSMAAPHVAGAVALYLEGRYSETPSSVTTAILNKATLNKIPNPGAGSPNRLLYTRFIFPGRDDAPPLVSITSPAAGATVRGTRTVSANATDDRGVSTVDFFVDGVSIASDNTAPYAVAWDTASWSNGVHALTARATDTGGQSTTSAPVRVIVENST